MSDKNLFLAPLVVHQNTAFAVGLLEMENQEKSKWYKGGRPKLNADEKRDKRVQVRFTVEEYEKVSTLQKKTRTRDMSTFIRKVCLHKPIRLKLPLNTYQENVLSLVHETRADALRMTSNVHLAAKHILETTNDERLRKEAELIWTDLIRLDVNLRAVLAAVLQTGDGPT